MEVRSSTYSTLGDGTWTVQIWRSLWTTAAILSMLTGWQYLIGFIPRGEKTGIYEVTAVQNSASVIGASSWPLGTLAGRHRRLLQDSITNIGRNTLALLECSDAEVFIDRVLDREIDLFTQNFICPYTRVAEHVESCVLCVFGNCLPKNWKALIAMQ
jgi:hypothetical protein